MFRFIQITIFLICFSQLATATPNTIENEPIYWGLGIGVIAVPNDHYDDLEGGVALINQVLIGKQYDLIWKVRFLTEAGYLQTYDNHIERENNLWLLDRYGAKT